MTGSSVPSPSVAVIAAMITPAFLILASASLVASALVRMSRVVDRARFLVELAYNGTWEKAGITSAQLSSWLVSHQQRASIVGNSIALLYAAIVAFIATVLSIALDRAIGTLINWLPTTLAVIGTLLLLAGGALMVDESRRSRAQILEEVRMALERLTHPEPR